MIDGLKQEQMLVGSGYIDFISGTDIKTGTQTTTTGVFTTANMTTGSMITANITTLNAVTLKAGSNALSSGSRWVVFDSAFANKNYHVAFGQYSNARVALDTRDSDWVAVSGVGYSAAGSFLAVGSPGTYIFDWVAIPRQC